MISIDIDNPLISREGVEYMNLAGASQFISIEINCLKLHDFGKNTGNILESNLESTGKLTRKGERRIFLSKQIQGSR